MQSLNLWDIQHQTKGTDFYFYLLLSKYIPKYKFHIIYKIWTKINIYVTLLYIHSFKCLSSGSTNLTRIFLPKMLASTLSFHRCFIAEVCICWLFVIQFVLFWPRGNDNYIAATKWINCHIFYFNNPWMLPLKNSAYLISQHFLVMKSATGCYRIYFHFQEYSELLPICWIACRGLLK